MKKKLCLLMALVCCVAVFAVAFAACNDNGGKSGGNVVVGDNIFTEDASYDDIYNALANAKSYQVTATYIEEDFTVCYTYTYTSDFYYLGFVADSDYGTYDSYLFIDGEYLYSVEIADYVEAVGTTVEKQLAKYEDYDVGFMSAAEYLDDIGLVIGKDGKLVVDEEGAMTDSDYVVGSGYIRCEGDALYVGYTYNSDEDGEMKTEYCIRGVNAQYSLPDEIRAMKADAVWARDVSYNGGHYEYGEYNGEECYYYLYGAEGEREDTINGLPVYDR